MSMLTRIEALNYRCLRYIDQPLKGFHVLVGPNASGKTTLLDVVAFLGTLVSDGLEDAVFERTHNFQDLVWQREGNRFELAVEARIPENLRENLDNKDFNRIRYEVALELNSQKAEIGIAAERVLLKTEEPAVSAQKPDFPLSQVQPTSLLSQTDAQDTLTTIARDSAELSHFRTESESYPDMAKVGPLKSVPGRSTLSIVAAFELTVVAGASLFSVTTWLKNLLTEGVQQLVLNSQLIRKASPPGQGRFFKPDGSNLPWVIEDLKKKSPERFRAWIAHLQTALPDIENIRIVEREDDRHRYLMVCYRGDLEVPSWMVSDGTLRLLALTLLAYLTDFEGVYLIEEPENGIHPRAVQTMIQSLSSVYNAQILLATHSPVILSFVDAEDVLCFAKNPKGETDIVSGIEHPALENWRGELSLSVLFASGVLG